MHRCVLKGGGDIYRLFLCRGKFLESSHSEIRSVNRQIGI
jgi:hypothetical protein